MVGNPFIGALIVAPMLAILALGLLGFPSRTPRACIQHGLNLIVEAHQRECGHSAVKADVLDGAVPDIAVRHCQSCGAVMVLRGVVSNRTTEGIWIEPRATMASTPLMAGRESRGAGTWSQAAATQNAASLPDAAHSEAL